MYILKDILYTRYKYTTLAVIGLLYTILEVITISIEYSLKPLIKSTSSYSAHDKQLTFMKQYHGKTTLLVTVVRLL